MQTHTDDMPNNAAFHLGLHCLPSVEHLQHFLLANLSPNTPHSIHTSNRFCTSTAFLSKHISVTLSTVYLLVIGFVHLQHFLANILCNTQHSIPAGYRLCTSTTFLSKHISVTLSTVYIPVIGFVHLQHFLANISP